MRLQRLGFLGPQGTFSHEAASQLEGNYEFIPLDSIPDVLNALRDGSVDRAIVPIENVIEDVVGQTVDWLIADEGSVKIVGELLLPIRQTILGQPGMNLEKVTEVISHPQPLGQCSKIINAYGWEKVEAHSTARAAKIVAEAGAGASMVAIGSPFLAELYGLEILQKEAADHNHNVTRFLVLGGEKLPPTGDDRTTIFLSTKDIPGAIHLVTGVFFYNGINLTKTAQGRLYQ